MNHFKLYLLILSIMVPRGNEYIEMSIEYLISLLDLPLYHLKRRSLASSRFQKLLWCASLSDFLLVVHVCILICCKMPVLPIAIQEDVGEHFSSHYEMTY